jgi:hypothetical protein
MAYPLDTTDQEAPSTVRDVEPLYGLIFGAGYAVADAYFGLVSTVWGRYVIARTRLALAGRLPWHLMAFLDDAHQHGVLRRAGAVYQFRHTRLQERLAAIG